MRIITCNTNGIRAAERKGFFPWLAEQDADVVCIQETKAQIHQLDPDLFLPEGYSCFYNDAERPGYSGTALFSRVKPLRITTKLGWEPMDSQGRYLQADFKDLSVISLYVPSGSSGDEAQARKEIFMTQFYTHLQSLRRKRREFVICADWNICHREIDLKNWRANRKNSGFLPHERPGLIGFLMNWVGWMCFDGSTPTKINTRGGRIVGRPGRRTWAGASITCCVPREWPSRSNQLPFTGINDSQIMHP